MTASVQPFAALCGHCCEALQGEHHLVVLDLNNNKLGNEGAAALAEAVTATVFDVWFGIARAWFPLMLLRDPSVTS